MNTEFRLILAAAASAALCASLSACGGGSDQQAPVTAAPPRAAPARVSGDGLVAYVGDDLVTLGCSATYNAPNPTFEQDTPNSLCSAVTGETSAQTLARFPTVLAQHPKVVVILTGFNDVRTLASPSTDAVGEMVQEAQAQGVIVILCNLPTTKGFDPEVQAWNAQIKLISRNYGTQFSDLDAGMANPAAVPDIPLYSPSLETAPLYDAAGKYPNANGYLVIWAVICESTNEDGVQSA
jgi:lysophospholipase L1-like esterase